MSSIEELQQRVIQAEERFGLINAERAKYSERLMGLIDAIETRLGDQQAEIERQAGEAASQAEELEILRRDAAENKPLRGMLQSLLNAIELGNDVALSETMQALDTKISALIDESNTAEAAPSEAETPAAEPQATEEVESEAPEIEAAEVSEEENADPGPEATEVADPEPETLEVVDPEPEATEVEAVETDSTEEDISNPPEEEAAVPEPEASPEAAIEAADDSVAADETQAAPDAAPAQETETETETDAPEVLEIPVSDAEVTMIDEELVLGAADDEASPVADAVEENLVDETDAVLDVPAAADAGEEKTEASSLEDIMRRVSKLVEDEGAMVSSDGEAPAEETSPDPEPAEAQNSATGG
jgi:hypothetical protein